MVELREGEICPRRIEPVIRDGRQVVEVPILDPRVMSDHVFGVVTVQMPPPWEFQDRRWLSFAHPDGRRVIVSADYYDDGRAWVHLSISRAHKMPSYRDLKMTKNELLGPEWKALHVFPPETELINFHPFCLHLFLPIGFDPLPDFTRGLGQI